MGNRGGTSELAIPGRASARLSPVYQRRTALWFWCGVFFCTLHTAACSPTGQQSPTPKDELIIGVPEGSVVSDQIGVGELISIFTLEGLTQADVDGRPVPRLAEKWSWERDGLQLRIYLRPGVRFHDGTPLEPAVAARIVQAAMERPSNRALYPWLNDVTLVRAEAGNQLVISLSQKSALIPEDLQFPLTIKTAQSDEVGTGPYRVASREADMVVLERFDQYHLGPPQIRRLVLSPFDTIRTAWTSLLRGTVDMVTDVPGEAIDFIRNDDIDVISFARRYQILVAFNVRRPSLSAPAVRRALNVAVDRNSLIQTVLQGHGAPATSPIWPKHWAYDASVASFGFDPAFATSLLDGAGIKPGSAKGASEIPGARMRFTCLLPAEFSILERVALQLQRQLYEIGVDIQFEVVPIEDYNVRIRTGQFDAVLIGLISGPTLSRPYIFWASARRMKGLNVFGYENEEAEHAFQLLRASTNEAAIRSAVSRLQRAFLNDPPAIFLAWDERTRAVRRDFKIVREADRDPLYTIWQWTENPDRRPVSTQ